MRLLIPRTLFFNNKVMYTIGKYIGKIVKSEYRNTPGRTAIIFADKNDNMIATLTVNLPEYGCKHDEVFLDANNNLEVDIVEVAHDLGLVTETIEWVKSGFVEYPRVKLNPNFKYHE